MGHVTNAHAQYVHRCSTENDGGKTYYSMLPLLLQILALPCIPYLHCIRGRDSLSKVGGLGVHEVGGYLLFIPNTSGIG